MMTTADNLPDQSGAPGTAPDAGLTIPKHRFDEVSERLRRKEEELAIKDRLYLEREQALQVRQAQPQFQEPTIEETGLDPQMHQAVVKVSKMIAGQMVGQGTKMLRDQIGILHGRTEKAELVATKGQASAKYLPEIERRQQEHWQRTGQGLPADIAYEMIRSEQKDSEIERLRAENARLSGQAPAQPAAQYAPPPPAAPQPYYAPSTGPSAAHTRQMPGGAPAGIGAGTQPLSSRSADDLNDDELEARLEEQARANDFRF